jgi:hypothetical protein
VKSAIHLGFGRELPVQKIRWDGRDLAIAFVLRRPPAPRKRPQGLQAHQPFDPVQTTSRSDLLRRSRKMRSKGPSGKRRGVPRTAAAGSRRYRKQDQPDRDAGYIPSDDVIERCSAQVEAEGQPFGGVYIDPVHKSVEDGANAGRINRVDKFLSSVVSLEIPFTGFHHTKEVRRQSFSATTLNEAHRAAAPRTRDGISLSRLQPGHNQQLLADRRRTGGPDRILVSTLQFPVCNIGVQEKRRTRTAYA